MTQLQDVTMEILEDTEFSRLGRFDAGLVVLLSTDDRYDTVTIERVDENFKTPIGRFEFDQPAGCPDDVYRLSYMALEGSNGVYRRKGIGREVLLFFIDRTGTRLVCDAPGGPANDYATHVVDDGIPFVCKMNREGLIWFPEATEEQLDLHPI